VKVEPTLRLFLVARAAPIMATLASLVASMVSPEVTLNWLPPATVALSWVAPMTVMGGEKVLLPPALESEPPAGASWVLPPLLTNRLPSDPASMAPSSVVSVVGVRRSLRVASTELTLASFLRLSIWAWVRGSPPPSKPRAPAGDTVMVLPMLA
jgi:hypothetical protein